MKRRMEWLVVLAGAWVTAVVLPVSVQGQRAVMPTNAACEDRIEGIETTCAWAVTPAGYRVRTILTRRAGTVGRLPALLFVQWLSCDPVALKPGAGDGWSRMLRELITTSGVVVARTEKPGLGESEGPACDVLGYDEELAAHHAALSALRASPLVHADSVFIFGASMGGTMAPLLARHGDVQGLIVAGTTGGSWLEHMIALDRRVLELAGRTTSEVDSLMRDQIRLHSAYLGEYQHPRDIVSGWSQGSAVWRRTLGTDSLMTSQYGRSVRFHHEAQRHNWSRAWESVRVPVLAIRGEHDWIMSREEHQRLLTAWSEGNRMPARLVTRPGMGHDFEVYPSLAASRAGKGGTFDTGVVGVMRRWLAQQRARQ